MGFGATRIVGFSWSVPTAALGPRAGPSWVDAARRSHPWPVSGLFHTLGVDISLAVP